MSGIDLLTGRLPVVQSAVQHFLFLYSRVSVLRLDNRQPASQQINTTHDHLQLLGLWLIGKALNSHRCDLGSIPGWCWTLLNYFPFWKSKTNDGQAGTGLSLFWYDNDNGPKVAFSVTRLIYICFLWMNSETGSEVSPRHWIVTHKSLLVILGVDHYPAGGVVQEKLFGPSTENI